MARHINPDSVSSKVAALEINEVVKFNNPYNSIAVMVSNVKKKEEHKYKVFKINFVGATNTTQVTRTK